MKKILLASLGTLIALSTYAQWNTSNDHIYNTNSGYVAIGLTTDTSPTSKLHLKQASNLDWATYLTNIGGSEKGLRIQAAANLNTVAIPIFQVDDL
jgi:hypothetical protein